MRQHLPVVVTGRNMKAPGLYALHFDNFEGGRLATHHLLSLGHRRIAFINGDTRHPDARERQRGYRAALEAAGLPFEPALVVPGQYTEDSGRMAVERLLDSREPFTRDLRRQRPDGLSAPAWRCTGATCACRRTCRWSASTTCTARCTASRR